ncbi:HPP family protein [Thiohalospira halophila DSM 15071]|uniref:HPP family protein n=1 Tax=Thiohalospira halophila DSM 15071 TaxID=1123397 RepID=A0A1I1R8M9_9GAMM|nr:HPP family protein [Thiohalospira halophila]SFD30701.1 HPP family protein [Thiohalospira halophila DSM 15071]
MSQPARNPLRRLIGPGTTRLGPAEIAVSLAGALVGIAAVHAVSTAILGPEAALFMVASMGAAAVLLFGVPHGALSQPWPAIGGQVISAAVGVTAATWIPDPALAAGVAVGGAIAAMQIARCIHPPGGATALIAVIGGAEVHALGYGYIVAPVLLNTLILFTIAVAANYPFVWRRYPIGLAPPAQDPPAAPLGHNDLTEAVRDLHVVVDITPDELDALARRAVARAAEDEGGTLPVGRRRVEAEAGEGLTIRKRHGEGEEAGGRVTLNVVEGDDGGDSRS